MRLQPDLPLDRSAPFSRADALASGMTLRELLGPSFSRLFHDVYVTASVRPDVKIRARAAVALSGRSAFASHATAAELWGAAVPEHGLVHVSVPDPEPRTKRCGIRAHRAIPCAEVVVRKGVRVSAPAQTLIEMARDGVGLVDLVVAGDGMVKAGSVTIAVLTAAARTWVGSGARVARRAVGLVREGVDSPMETRLRLLIVLAGLPEPAVNHIVRNRDGSWQMRFDLYYPGLKLLVEYDGRQHSNDERQWKRDIRRREELDKLGERLLVVLSDGIYEDPGETLDRIAMTMRELGDRHVRRAYKPEWRRYFPGRAGSL